MFEKATRMKLRFESQRGPLSTEDLWDLPLTGRTVSLDDIARSIHKQIKEEDNDISFVTPSVSGKESLMTQLRFDIVKHIIDVKIAERDAAYAAADKKAKKQKIMELIDKKQDEALSSKSVEELLAMIDN